MVFVPTGTDWTDLLVNELLRFPNGVHDDQVDALAWLGQMMSEFHTWRERAEAPRRVGGTSYQVSCEATGTIPDERLGESDAYINRLDIDRSFTGAKHQRIYKALGYHNTT